MFSSMFFVQLVLTFDQSLFMNYFEQERAFGGVVDSGAPKSVKRWRQDAIADLRVGD